MTALLEARRLNPLSSEILLDLAANYDEAGTMDEAGLAYQEAERVYPFSADVHWSYGNFLLRQRQIPAAFSEIHSALQLDPKRKEAHGNIAELYMKLGKKAEAKRHYEEYLKLYPTSPKAEEFRKILQTL